MFLLIYKYIIILILINFIVHFDFIFSSFFNFSLYQVLYTWLATPFIFEFWLFILSICYLIICCFATQKWWDFKIILRLFFWIKFFFVISLFIFIFLLFYKKNFDISLFFGNILINDFISNFIKILLILLIFLFLTNWFTFLFINLKYWKSINEFIFIFLSCSFFLLVLPILNDLFFIVYVITAISICIYGLILINIPIIAKGTETGAKYFLLSVCSVALIFGGIKEIHLNIGHLNFSIINNTIFEQIVNCTNYFENLSLKFGIILLIVGFFFKISAAPNHFWAPEVYSGLPYELLFFIVVPIKYIFCFVFFKILKNIFYIFAINTQLNLILWNEIEICLFCAIILSLFIGAINALFETNLKKFIAYSSINQIGFLLITFLGFNSNIYCIESFLYFLFIYLLNLTIFILYFIYFSQLFFIPVFLYKFLYKFFQFKFKSFFLIDFLYTLKIILFFHCILRIFQI